MLDSIMNMAVGMKAVGISAEIAKAKIFKRMRVISSRDINLIVDVVYMED